MNCIIFPCLVLVGPVFLVYMLYSCYLDNGVTSNSFIELLFGFFPKLPATIEKVSNTYHEAKKQVKDMSKVKTRASIISLKNVTSDFYNETVQRSLESVIPATEIVAEEVIDNSTHKNETAKDVWTECNVILLPFLIFLFFCMIIFYVLCRYKICNSEMETEEGEADNK